MEQENSNNRTKNILDFIQVACFDLDLNYNCVYLNKGAEALISVTREQAIEKNLSEFLPVDFYEECFTIIKSAVFSKKKEKQSIFFEPIKKWLFMEVIPDSERILLLFTENIDEHLSNREDHNEAHIQTKRLLVSIMNSSIFSINVYKSIRNDIGDIIDFEFVMISELTENITGLTDLPGKRLLEQFPQIIKIGLFDKFVKVVEDDIVLDHEENLNYVGFDDKYIRRMVMKLNDGFLSSWIDISKQKLAEYDRINSLTLLKQAEELAQIGSWEFDVSTGDFLWSDGMYHLFGLTMGIEVKPEVYLQQVVFESKENADRFVHNLRNYVPAFEETLKIRSGNQYKIIKVKANTIFNENSEPIKVLGVDIDITEQVRLHDKNSRLSKERRAFKEKQQQEVFKAILNTQQEERKRIAEGLHNGLGQHLYGVKLSLSKNIMDQAPLIPYSQLRAMKQTEKLLADVIMEARKLSHELMPSTLEDFGLKAAIEDICTSMGQSINVHYKVSGPTENLENHIQIGIYRIVQELMLNIAKHAEATQINLEIAANKSVINMFAEDNGKGFDPNVKKANGIGLKSIQTKLKLLSGSLKIDSTIGQGTKFSITIPLKNL